MPSLVDSLEALADHSKQITQLSSYNAQPPGPFLQAFLRPSVLTLIRDPEPKEVRLFKFVGEEGGGKRVEKREEGLVTPLKKLKGKQAAGVENVEVMLRTALRLADDYGPMPRARSHIKDLIRAHDQQMERVAELEELLEEARRPRPPKPSADSEPKPLLDIDEIIKAEEEALKTLEGSINAMKSRRSPSPDKISPAPKAPRWSVAAQTPGKTPISSRQISNSLVSGQTPRRATQPSRFSPLKLLTTPRVQKGRKSIFARQAPRAPSALIPQVSPAVPEEIGDETIRIAAVPIASPEPSPQPRDPGVDLASQSVREGVGKIESTMGELLQQGTSEPPSGIEAVYRHLVHLSKCNPDPLPSPTSTASAPSQALRITTTTILTAHLLLMLLSSPDGSAVMNEVKEKLGAVAQEKGWAEGQDLGTKVVYQAMGKKCVKIDRRGGNGGKVLFAA